MRLALSASPDVRFVEVNLSSRTMTAVHEGSPEALSALLAPLNVGARLVSRADADLGDIPSPATGSDEARALALVLAINATMFVGEMVGAYLADSSALLADSLDMFADAAVYGIALFGVSRTHTTQLTAARVSGVLQFLLALGALTAVAHRLWFGSTPEAPTMLIVACAALAANTACMWLLARHRHGGAHMKASWIFTTNDVIANMGVIAAAGLVRLLGSNIPDLVVATGISLIVLNGAIRILRLKA